MSNGRESTDKQQTNNELSAKRLRAIRGLLKLLKRDNADLNAANDALALENARLRSDFFQVQQALEWANLRLSWASEEPEVPADFGFLKTAVHVLPSTNHSHHEARENGSRSRPNLKLDSSHTNGAHANGARLNGIDSNGIHQNGAHANGARQNGTRTNGHDATNGLVTGQAALATTPDPTLEGLPQPALLRALDGPMIARVFVMTPPVQTPDAFGRLRRVWRFQRTSGDLRLAWSTRSPLMLCLAEGEVHEVLVSAITSDLDDSAGMLESVPAPRPWSRDERL